MLSKHVHSAQTPDTPNKKQHHVHTIRALTRFLSACDQIRRGARQSRFVIYKSLESLPLEDARNITKTALWQSGAELDKLIIIVGDGGEYLEWIRS